MKKRILIVNNDKTERISIQRELQKRDKQLSVLMAEDGVEAIDYLTRYPVSLVISDIHMPRMDGIQLLVFMVEHFPDVPVMINVGYGGAAVGGQVKANGAEDYLEKPIHAAKLHEKIQLALNKQGNGGTLRNVSTGTFLQMLEMEQRSCMIRVMENQTEAQGTLFVRNGKLVDARISTERGKLVALELLAWDNVTLFIQNDCPEIKDNLRTNLQGLLLESMRIKDEVSEPEMQELTAAFFSDLDDLDDLDHAEEEDDFAQDGPPDVLKVLRESLEQKVGQRSGVNDIYQDDTWSGLIGEIRKIEPMLESGNFNVGFINKDASNDFFLLPGEVPTVISVDPKCMRDKIMSALCEEFNPI